MKTSKKSLLASGVSLLASAVLLAGATFAWFTDSVTNTGNKIQAGKLDVTLEKFDPAAEEGNGGYVDAGSAPLFDYDKWEPGYTAVASVKIGNNGTLALKYEVDLVVNGGTSALADVIDVYYRKDAGAVSALPDSLDGLTKVGTLSELLAETRGAATGHLSAGGADFATIALHMQEGAGNAYQELSVGTSFDIVVRATQYTEEEDGFGNNQYDADAELVSAVTLQLDYNPAFAAANPDKIAQAEAMLDKDGYASVVAAHQAFQALFADGAPLFTVWNATESVVDKVTYLIRGTVAAGETGNGYNLAAGPRNAVSVDLIGADDLAKITGNALFTANVAGGYTMLFVEEGTFNVRNIEFTATSGNTSLGISGNIYGADNILTNAVTLNIEGCTFHNQLYFYHNDTATVRTENIKNNHFINDGTTGYAYFHQGSDFRGDTNTVTFEGNTVEGYSRGINLQSNKTDFVLRGNTLTSTNSMPDRGALQLTDAKTFVVEDNTISVSGGNAFWFHDAAQNTGVTYAIRNNRITAPYLANDDTSFGAGAKISSSGNTLNIAYPGMCMEKGASTATPSDITLN